jgi:hypothetical protein
MKNEMTAIITRRCALLLALLLLLVAAPAASAQGWDDGWDDDAPQEESWDDTPEWDEPEPAPAPSPTPAPAAPVQPSFDGGRPDDGGWFDAPEQEEIPLVTTATVAGKAAMLRTNGKAAIPRGAPKRVRAVIAAANQIAGKPYKWGGGHAKLVDRGYDCSGTVSYALIRSGFLVAPLVSGSFAKWGEAGDGRWISVYANKGHVYMEVAGLRLDTSAAGDRNGGDGVRWRPVTGRRRGFKARHIAGL